MFEFGGIEGLVEASEESKQKRKSLPSQKVIYVFFFKVINAFIYYFEGEFSSPVNSGTVSQIPKCIGML